MMERTFALLGFFLLFAGCTGPRPDYDPGVSAEDFVSGIGNPWLPYPVGAYWIYEADTGDEVERIEVRVLAETRNIMGVEATVVRDTVTIDGVLAEDTYDWFAQDRHGNVWYLGEESKEYDDGEFAGTEGSWEWGRDGALPGILMWADPEPNGTAYYQEFYWGEAVDKAAVIDAGRVIETEAGTFSDTVTTKEWNPLEPGVVEHAHYARGIGVVLKEVVEGDERGEQEMLIEYHLP